MCGVEIDRLVIKLTEFQLPKPAMTIIKNEVVKLGLPDIKMYYKSTEDNDWCMIEKHTKEREKKAQKSTIDSHMILKGNRAEWSLQIVFNGGHTWGKN